MYGWGHFAREGLYGVYAGRTTGHSLTATVRRISSCLQIARTSFQSISPWRGTADRGPASETPRVVAALVEFCIRAFAGAARAVAASRDLEVKRRRGTPPPFGDRRQHLRGARHLERTSVEDVALDVDREQRDGVEVGASAAIVGGHAIRRTGY